MVRRSFDLMATEVPRRNWWGIGIALLVILSIAACIAVTIVSLTPSRHKHPESDKTPFAIEDIVGGQALQHDPRAQWASKSLLYYRDNDCKIRMINIDGDSASEKTLPDVNFCGNQCYDDFVVSPSGRCMAYACSTEQIFRHSERGVYNVSCDDKFENTSRTYFVGPAKDGKELVQLFLWNPDASATDFIYVYNNNIFYQEDAAATSIAVTKRGREDGTVRCGIPDWIYEEEILESRQAVWWSQTSNYIAYMVTENSDVPEVNLPYYNGQDAYPSSHAVQYPKVGFKLPTVSVEIWSKTSRTSRTIVEPPEVKGLGDRYMIRLAWLTPREDDTEALLVVWSNRVQDEVYITYCTAEDGTCLVNYQQSHAGYWARPAHYDIVHSERDKYFAILPTPLSLDRRESDNRYAHIAQISLSPTGIGGKAEFLTEGPWEAVSIVGYSSSEQILYFIAALPLPRSRHLYSVSTAATSRPQSTPTCLTCNLTDTGCTHFWADFSATGRQYVLTAQGPSCAPLVSLFSTKTRKPMVTIEDNGKARAYLAQKRCPKIVYDQIKMPNGYDAILKVLYPPDIDEDFSNTGIVPVVLRVYAGPDSQMVNDEYTVDFDTFLVTNRSYVVVMIDGRGSALRGTSYVTPVYRALGTAEIEDQITAFKLFLTKKNIQNRNKALVWGWSYGGFAAARIVQQDQFDVFKCAASVAPVTNFLYYDAAYTERYLGLYNENRPAYDRTNLTINVAPFAKGDYLLVHGTYDENVHFQNTAELAKALTANNVQFRMMTYPNEKHSIRNRRLHLYTMLDKFFASCLS